MKDGEFVEMCAKSMREVFAGPLTVVNEGRDLLLRDRTGAYHQINLFL